MKYFSKQFNKKTGYQKSHSSSLSAGLSDIEKAYQFAEEGKWEDALDVVDQILDIPEDTDTAIGRLRSIIQDEKLVDLKNSPIGKDASGNWVAKMRMMIVGGMIPTIMGFRGQCIVKTLLSMLKKIAPGKEVAVIRDSEFNKVANKGLQHVDICSQLFWDDPDNLAFAGTICHTVGKLDAAIELFERALKLDPRHAIASEAIQMTKQRLEQFRDL
jgi:tetratricopeptide (TPR) repeat protein